MVSYFGPCRAFSSKFQEKRNNYLYYLNCYWQCESEQFYHSTILPFSYILNPSPFLSHFSFLHYFSNSSLLPCLPKTTQHGIFFNTTKSCFCCVKKHNKNMISIFSLKHNGIMILLCIKFQAHNGIMIPFCVVFCFFFCNSDFSWMVLCNEYMNWNTFFLMKLQCLRVLETCMTMAKMILPSQSIRWNACKSIK